MLNCQTQQRLSAIMTEDQLREFYKYVEIKRQQTRKLLNKIRATQS